MVRQYEGELNRVVSRADDEISRIDSHYLTAGETAEAMAPDAGIRAAQARAQKTMEGGS
jgi:tRNA G37 N-methylase TrmD